MSNQPRQEGGQTLGPVIDPIETIVLGIGRFRYWVIPFAAIGTAIGIFLALIKPNTFQSTAKLWVEWGAREELAVEPIITGSRQQKSAKMGGIGMEEEFQLIRTVEFYERVAREVGPERLMEPIDPTRYDTSSTPWHKRKQHELQDWYFNRGREKDPEAEVSLNLGTRAGVTIARSKVGRGMRFKKVSPNIFTISYTALSPELAQDVVEAAAKVAIETHHEVYANRFKPEFVNAQLEIAQREADESSRYYYDHTKDCGFFDLPQQKAQLIDDVQRISRKLEEDSDRLEKIKLEREHSEQLLAETPERVTIEHEAEIGDNPFWESINKEIAQAKTKLLGLGIEYVEGSESYIKQKERIEAEIANLEKALAEQEPKMVKREAYSEEVPNKDYIALKRKLTDLDLETTQINEQEVRFRERLVEIDKDLQAVMACEPRHKAMAEEIAKAKATARQLQSELDRRAALDLLKSDEELGNMWVMLPATYNPNKTGPARGKTILLGIAGGIGAGIVFGILRQLLDGKFRYPSSVQKSLGVPVLGVIPERKGWRKLGLKLRKANA